MNERSSVHGEDDRTCRSSLYAKAVAPAESFDQAVATSVRIGGAQKHVLVSRVRPSRRARVTPEGLLGLREIEKDFPALVEVLKRFLDFGNRIDRGHRNGQRAGGDEGSCLDLRGEHLGDMVVVA